MGSDVTTATETGRTLPLLTPLNTFFWTAGRTGRLEILRCDACAHWLHPPAPICPECLGRELTPQPVSGLGTVEAVTINHHPWTPAVAVPYAVILVALEDCAYVRLTSRLVVADPYDATIGMRVRVAFEQDQDVWLPFFEPAGAAA